LRSKGTRQISNRIPHGRPKRAKPSLLALLLLAACGTPPIEGGQSNGASEYTVKAAFLFHFAQFVEWPVEAFADENSALTYCTMGEDPFGGALNESVNGKSIGNRRLQVKHVKELEQIAGCQVLFIAAGEKKRHGEELAMASKRPVLTVGETDGFATEGGIIGFCREQNKIRFEINLDAAGKAQLKISAKLLSLAKTVIGSPRGN
jgi:YfiR/HmsC-like